MMMIGSDDRGRVKIVLYGINSKMADVSLTSFLLAEPHIILIAFSTTKLAVGHTITWEF